MKKSEANGVLVLICRSVNLDDFAWFKTLLNQHFSVDQKRPFKIIDVDSTETLISNLAQPNCLFDISEVHLLAEFHTGSFQIGPNEKLSTFENYEKPKERSITGGKITANARIKIWYWSDKDNPDYAMLTDWARFFQHRFYFLPLTQLKQEIRSYKKNKTPKAQELEFEPALPKRIKAKAPFRLAAKVTAPQVIMLILLIGGFKAFFVTGFDYEGGAYSETIRYHDTDEDIETVTRPLTDKSGDMIEHNWVFNKAQWQFTFFIADEWLEESKQDLINAEANATGSGNRYWGSVYQQLISANDQRLDNIAKTLRYYGRLHNLDEYELASLVLSFVQHIPYKIPSNSLELLGPPQTVHRRYGDCDTKSLLYTLLLKRLGYDTAMFVSIRYLHAMAGVSINAIGTHKSYQGRNYYFAETTAVGHRIGSLSASQGSLGHWLLVPLGKEQKHKRRQGHAGD